MRIRTLVALIAMSSLTAYAAGLENWSEPLPRTLAQLISKLPSAELRIGYAADNAIWKEVPLSNAGDPYISISMQGVEIARAPCTDQCRWTERFELQTNFKSNNSELDLYLVTPQVLGAYGARVGDSLDRVVSQLPDPRKAVLVRFDSTNYEPVEALCIAGKGPEGFAWVEFFLRPVGSNRMLGRYEGQSTMTRKYSSNATVVAIRWIKHECEQER